MGKPTGFMEYARELPHDRSPKERTSDWKEFHEHFAEEKLRTQGARCIDCGIPFCHTGTLISGMASGCPVNKPSPARFRKRTPPASACSPSRASRAVTWPH